MTPDSGTATPRATAVDSGAAMVSLPAPVRSAARPASSTAPGVLREPPMTRTVPLSCLPPSSSTSSGQPRNNPGVMMVGSAAAGGDIGLLGHRCRSQATGVVEHRQLGLRTGQIEDRKPAVCQLDGAI